MDPNWATIYQLCMHVCSLIEIYFFDKTIDQVLLIFSAQYCLFVCFTDLPDPLPPYTYQGQLTSAKVISSESFSESPSEFESSRIFTIPPVIIPAEIQDVEMEDA